MTRFIIDLVIFGSGGLFGALLMAIAASGKRYDETLPKIDESLQ